MKSSQIQMKRKRKKCQNHQIKPSRGECNLISPCDAEEKIASAIPFCGAVRSKSTFWQGCCNFPKKMLVKFLEKAEGTNSEMPRIVFYLNKVRSIIF